MPKIDNKIVVRFRDGTMVKGYTHDFNPNKGIFHVAKAQEGNGVVQVSTADMKVVFFVKSFEGDKEHPNFDDFSMEKFKSIPGLKLKIVFFDNEVIYGSNHGYSPQRKGFFIFPANKELNHERVFVIRDATVSVETWR